VLQFRASAHDRVATEARDLDQTLDATAPPLERQQADEPPPVLLIERGQHAIDCPMVFCHTTIRMLSTHVTGADMIRLSRLRCHRHSFLDIDGELLRLDPHRQERAYYKIVKLF
jgi:hypothetical protein